VKFRRRVSTAVDTVKCPKCGAEVDAGANRCPKCGYYLYYDKLAEWFEEAEVPVPEKKPPKKGKPEFRLSTRRRISKANISLALSVLTGLAFILLWFVLAFNTWNVIQSITNTSEMLPELTGIFGKYYGAWWDALRTILLVLIGLTALKIILERW